VRQVSTIFGISRTQVVHQVAQKFTSTTLPRRSDVEKCSPASVSKRASGAWAGRSAKPAAKAAIATAAKAAIILSFMRATILVGLSAAVITWGTPALAQLERITNTDATAGLKAALEKGSRAAVGQLGRLDGFLGNPKVKIPLPESLARVEPTMRRFGMGHYADELIVAMNRAAEAAVPQASALFVDSVKKMTLQDAKGILTGGDTAGTEYFRRTTQGELHKRFLPVVEKSTAKVEVARKYDQYAGRAQSLGLVKDNVDLDEYVTTKALDGLYYMVGEEEKKIRKDPVGTGSNIISKVFGALH